MRKSHACAAMLLAAMLPLLGADNMKAFPPAEPGMERFVLNLPVEVDESALKVELIVGQTVLIDDQNSYFFGGKIEDKNIEGWGFTRYIVSKIGPMAGTRMAADPNAPKLNKFVSLGGEPYLIRYNSKLPVVIYVPEGAEVRYRIWTAPAKSTAVDKG